MKSIYVDGKGNVYAGTNTGLSMGKKDAKGYHFTSYYSYGSELGVVNSVYLDTKGMIYLATNNGLYIGKKDQLKETSPDDDDDN